MKKKLALILASVMLFSNTVLTFAADNDGWTEAKNTAAAQNGAWEQWCNRWENEKENWEQVSLTPGSDESKLNFAWYSKDGEGLPQFKMYTQDEVNTSVADDEVASCSAITVTDNGDNSYRETIALNDGSSLEVQFSQSEAVTGYKANKVTVDNLKSNTLYYYSYTKDGQWTAPTEYRTQDAQSGKFSFMFFGDPQIGSSSGNTPTGESTEQGQEAAVRNDSFNWNDTVEKAYAKDSNVSFMISAGDQIQSRDKKTADKTHATYTGNEIEYAGYLLPDRLKSIPVATTVGNHDANASNYGYHFNTPNESNLGSTYAGGDYYFNYGNTLFIMLNTNNTNVTEHSNFIKEAVASNKNAKWKVVTLHQDIYGSGVEHSNEPEIIELRYNLVPILEENGIDVVLTGHDHTYSRSYILKGGVKDESKMLTTDEYDDYIDGKTPIDDKYNNYLSSIEDANAVKSGDTEKVVNPEGILYMTANSASGSKYYDLVERKQAYIADNWQEDVPTFSMINVSDKEFTINTYRTDNMEKIDTEFTIEKDPNYKPSGDEAGFTPEDLALTPGADEKALNFAWYSNTESGNQSMVKIKKNGEVVAQSSDGKTEEVSGVYADGDAVSAGTQLTGKLSHKASVSGLELGTEYTYQISNDGVNWSKEFNYTTEDGGDFKFAVVGDPQLKEGQNDATDASTSLEQSWNNTVNAISAQGASFIASVGDQTEGKKINGAYKTNEKEYTSFFAAEKLKNVPYSAVVGNHDINYGFNYHFNLPNEQAPKIIETFNNKDDEERKISEAVGNYYYKYNDALFVVLNDSAYPCDSTENYEAGLPVAQAYVEQFDKTMAEAVKAYPEHKWLFVQHHKSTRTAAQHACDFDVQSFVEAGIEKLMDKYDVDMVFAGHDHVYTKSFVLNNGEIKSTAGETSITNPEGTVYFTADTASGKEYYDIFSAKAKKNNNYPLLADGTTGYTNFVAGVLPYGIDKAEQPSKPSYYMVDVKDNSVSIKAYYTSDNTIYDELTLIKGEDDVTTENTTENTTVATTVTTTVATTEATTETTTTQTTTKKTSSSSSGGGGGFKANIVNGGKIVTSATETTTETTTVEEKSTEATTRADVSVKVGSNSVTVNGKDFTIDSKPYIQNSSSSVLVPLRFVAIAICGQDVDKADVSSIIKWDNVKKTATITYGGSTIVFTNGNSTYTVDGKTVALENNAKAEIKDGRMYVPFRSLGTALGNDVEWDSTTKTAMYK